MDLDFHGLLPAHLEISGAAGHEHFKAQQCCEPIEAAVDQRKVGANLGQWQWFSG
jgi:hypothetical protein